MQCLLLSLHQTLILSVSQPKSGLISTLYLLLFALMPFVYINSVVDNTLVPRQVFAVSMLLIAGLLLWGRSKKFGPVQLGWPLILFSVFLLVNVVSISQAINAVDSYAVVSRYLLMFCFLALTLHLLQERQLDLKKLIGGAIIFTGISALVALFKIFQVLGSGDFVQDIYEVRGSFGHKNLLSSALMLGLPFAIMGSVIYESTLHKRLSLALAMLVVAEIFVLRTRGVWLATFVGSGLALSAFFVQRAKMKLIFTFPFKWLGIGFLIAAVLLVGLFATKGFQENISDRSNLDRRIVFWQNSLDMIADHPVLGVGAGNWRINFPKYGLSQNQEDNSDFRLDQNVYQGITHIQRPHNDYLWVWSEAGPLALLAYLGLFLLALVRAWRNLGKAENTTDLAYDLLSIFGITTYLVFSFTDFPLERTSHQLLVLALVVIAFRNAEAAKLTLPFRSVLVLVLIFLLGSLWVGINRWQGEVHTVDVHEANSSRNARKIIPAVEAAENGFYNMDQYANPLRYYSSIGKLALQDVPGAFEDIQMALEVHPYNIIVLNQMGNVYKTQGNLDEALKYYGQSVEISRWFESGRLNLAEVYLKKDQPLEALAALSLVRRSSRNPKFLELLAQSLPRVVETYSQHGRFGPLVEYLKRRNPQSREQYVQYFLEFKLPASNS